ncbi:MAG: lysylphosphatidylglycerol synthase domain-containing protein [Pseudonocardiales bacterium]|nr:flippase-like domain-containing protein [Actinomycetota bacterium]
MSATLTTWARLLGGAAILAVLGWRLGAAPFLDGLALVDGRSLAAAAGLTALSTVCCAWRWSLVARGLGVGMPLRTAVAAYYRSQFLNTALPGGVLGDVHRGVSHGRGAGDLGRGLRAVAWERCAGQVVQAVLTLTALLLLASPVRSSMPAATAAVAAGAIVAVTLARSLPRVGQSRRARTLRAAAADIRDGLLARRSWPGIVLASALVVACHTATFLVAARTAGATASTRALLPLALLVLLAMALPTNIGGWGPREGAAAWAFGAAGLGAAQGLAIAVVYGVMVFVASLPGAALLAMAWFDRHSPREGRVNPPRLRAMNLEGARRG